MSSNYRNGGDLERAAKHELEDNGYFVVKSAGSKGKADLVALKRGEVVLVQCKLDGYLRPAERGELAELAGRLDAQAIIAFWLKDGRAARQVCFLDLADRTPWTPNYALEEM